MNLEQQVISLDLAKRLKALGVKQESYFTWVESNGRVMLESKDKRELIESAEGQVIMAHRTYYAAFTTSELGEMLPDYVVANVGHLQSRFSKMAADRWTVEYVNRDEDAIQKRATTEAEARGLMLEYLITNKLMSV